MAGRPVDGTLAAECLSSRTPGRSTEDPARSRRGALRRRAAHVPVDGQEPWNGAECRRWGVLLANLRTFAGGALPALSRKDAALCLAATKAENQQQLRAAVEHHQNSGRQGELLTDNPRGLLSRDSVLRHYVNEQLRSKTGVYATPEV